MPADPMPARLAELTARFSTDPEALEWARGHVEALEAQFLRFASHVKAQGDEHNAERFAWLAGILRRELIGGTGCVITPFDERHPSLPPLEPPAREDTR